jgi:signal recognition particle GTPase
MVSLGLTLDQRFALANRVEAAGDFSDLPEQDKRAILAAEKIAERLASGEVTLQDLISQTETAAKVTVLAIRDAIPEGT